MCVHLLDYIVNKLIYLLISGFKFSQLEMSKHPVIYTDPLGVIGLVTGLLISYRRDRPGRAT